MTGLADEQKIAPSFYDGWKRAFLGKPMITDDLQHAKLSNTVALGALSPDAISSTAYGPEQIMVELLPAAGMAALVLLGASAQIVTYDIGSRIAQAQADRAASSTPPGHHLDTTAEPQVITPII